MNKKAVAASIAGISSVAVSGVSILAMEDSDYDSHAVADNRHMAAEEEQWANHSGYQPEPARSRKELCEGEMSREDIVKFDQALQVLIETRQILKRRIHPHEPEEIKVA